MIRVFIFENQFEFMPRRSIAEAIPSCSKIGEEVYEKKEEPSYSIHRA